MRASSLLPLRWAIPFRPSWSRPSSGIAVARAFSSHLRAGPAPPRFPPNNRGWRCFSASTPARFNLEGDSTIYALSTASGRAAIAVVRVSGSACVSIYKSLCPNAPLPKPRVAAVRTLYHPESSSDNANVLDAGALVLYFPAPKTVTGEDVLEFQLHGGPAIVKSVLGAIASHRPTDKESVVRYAEPGEFTRRAFMNNRLDLPQIEALGETLMADTEQQRRLAVRGSSDALSKRYEAWRHGLLYARGELEALIDFAEDQHFDESTEELLSSVSGQIRVLQAQIGFHIQNASKGELLRNGIRIALLGAPNAGKSSLLNRVVGKEAAIVSTEEGTTRDIVDVGVDLGGWYCKLGDMAGIRSGSGSGDGTVVIGPVEKEGIRRARARALESDVVIVVAALDDGGRLFIEPEVIEATNDCVQAGKAILVAVNKCDRLPTRELPQPLTESIRTLFPAVPKDRIFGISCQDAETTSLESQDQDPGNLQTFLRGLINTFEQIASPSGIQGDEHGQYDVSYWEDSLGVTHRQSSNLQRCKQYLDDFLIQTNPSTLSQEVGLDEYVDGTGEVDIVTAAENLRFAADALAKITGKGESGDVEDVLGVVFEKAMDPVSAFGLASGAVQIAQVVAQTIKGLVTLRGKFNNADLTILSLIGELTTIESAVIQLDNWARCNARDSPEFNDYNQGFNVALEGCRAIMDVFKEDVGALAQGTVDGTVVGFRTRAKVVWNEDIMRDHQSRLHAQVLALQLLLQACQCRSSSEQIALLRKAENRQIIQKVADDTATLRTRSHYAMSRVDSVSLNNGQPSVGDTVFDFDDTVVNSRAYREVLRHARSKSERSQSGFVDEGYGTGLARNTPNASIPSRSPSQPHPYEPVSPDFGRKTTNSSRANALHSNQGNIQRWQSDSAYSSALPSRSGSRREKIRALIRRLSSTSGSGRSDSPMTSPVVESASGRRGYARDFNTSINLKTLEGASAPVIVKTAQTGSRDDVERLIQSGHDIEARHIHSRRNALLVAAHCGNDEIVDLLIQNNARLDVADGSGSTAVHLAASRGHLEALGLLLSENVDIETRNSQGRTALWLAADQCQFDAIRMLVATQAKVNTRADNQMTALHAAAKRGDVDIVDLLISQGADLEAKDASMMTALHYASEEGHLSVIELLVSTSRVDINTPGSDRRTPLICGAAMGRLPVVQLLLRKKVSIKSADDAGMTALHWAAFNGHTEIVGLLGQKKGPLAVTNIAGRTALHLAVMNAQFAVVELLCRRDDVSLLEARCESGLTPLHYACIADNLDITRLLLATGSNIEEPTDGDQRRPVHIAAACGSMGLLNLLCDKGASLDARDAIGDRAICVACRQGRASAAQNLLNRGSALYMKFGNGSRLHEDSPLCLAAMGGHYPVVSLLLQYGASPVRSDETGWQPARYAAYYGHPEVLQLLLANSPTSANDVVESGPGLTISESIGFAPHAVIPEERKRRVQELLDQNRRQPPAATGHPPRPIQMSPFEPVNNQTTMPPQELPSTLEQGLPDSRSVTPDQMRRDNTTSSQAAVGTADLQQALPPAYEQTPTAPIQQPQAVGGIGAVQPWVDTLPLGEHALLSTGVSASPTALPVSGAQDISRRLHTLLHHHPTERGDDARSETSSVTSVYTAPEGATVYELPG